MQRSSSPPPLPGDRVGHYLLVRPLGVGAMATVYEGRGPGDEQVAIKVLHPGRAGTEEERRFKREILTLMSLDHPGVVRVLDAGRQGDYPWMAMEYVAGTDLATLLERWRDSPPPDRFAVVEPILRGLCEALSAVHARGLIHRDLKPSNVLLTHEGHVKLTDFGVVRTESGSLLGETSLVGTLAFMSPEQIRGAPLDSRSDLYALGAVLYALLTGEVPIRADSVAGYLARQLNETPRPPSELDPRVPPHLERACLQLLEKDPARRYASARQVIAALERAEDGQPRPLRGRDALLARLLDRFQALREGRGGLLVLTGPPGSGKSALLSELAARARARGHDVATSSGADPDPLAALAEQLPDLGASLHDAPDAGACLVRRARGRPWVLFVDDLDLLGGEQLDALTALARDRIAIEGDLLLLVGAVVSAEGPVSALCTGASTGLAPEIVPLPALEEADVASIAVDQGIPGTASHVIGRRLVAAGVQWPSEVLARIAAMERAGGLVRAQGGGLLPARGLEPLEEQPLPPLAAEPRGPWAELEGAAAGVAELLAALDGEAPLGLARALLGEGADEGVSALVARGLVTTQAEEDDDLIRLAAPAEGAIAPERRRAVHADVADAIQRWAPSSGRWVPILADQLQRAGRTSAAWPLLVEAARLRLRQRQPQEAWRWLRRALEARGPAEPLLDEQTRHATRQRLYAVEGDLWAEQSAWASSLEAWSRALLAAQWLGDEGAAARALSGQGRALEALGDLTAAARALQGALDRLSQGDPAWLPTTIAAAKVRTALGEAEAAAALWRAVLRFAEEAQLPEQAASAALALESLGAPGPLVAR